MFAKSLFTLGTTSQIRLTRIKRNITKILNQFVDTSVISTVAGSGLVGSAVEYPLDGEVNVVTLALAGDFDAVG
jgi:hypothetical protein